MISNENKSFLMEKFGINCDKYDKEKLSRIIDIITKEVEEKIDVLQNKNRMLKNEIDHIEQSA